MKGTSQVIGGKVCVAAVRCCDLDKCVPVWRWARDGVDVCMCV